MDRYKEDRLHSHRRTRSTERHRGPRPPSRHPVSQTTIQTPGSDEILLVHEKNRHRRHEDTTSYRPSSRNANRSREHSFREDEYSVRGYTSPVQTRVEYGRARDTPLEPQILIVPEEHTSRRPSIRNVRPVSVLRTRVPKSQDSAEVGSDGRYPDYRYDNSLRTDAARVEGSRYHRGSVTVNLEPVVDLTLLSEGPPNYHTHRTQTHRYAEQNRGKDRGESQRRVEEGGYNVPRDDDDKRPGDSRERAHKEASYKYIDDNNYYHEVLQRRSPTSRESGYPSSSHFRPANTRGLPQLRTWLTPARESNAGAVPRQKLSHSPGYQKGKYRHQRNHNYEHGSPHDEARRGRSPTPRENTNTTPIMGGRRDNSIPLHTPIPTHPSQTSSISAPKDIEINESIATFQSTPVFADDQLDANRRQTLKATPIDMLNKMRKATPIRRQTPPITTMPKEMPKPRRSTKEYRDHDQPQQRRARETRTPTDGLPRGDGRRRRAQQYDHGNSYPQQEREYKDQYYPHTSNNSKPKTMPSGRNKHDYTPEEWNYDRHRQYTREHDMTQSRDQNRPQNPIREKTQVYRDDRFTNAPPKAEPKPKPTLEETAQRLGYTGKKVPVRIVYEDGDFKMPGVGNVYKKPNEVGRYMQVKY